MKYLLFITCLFISLTAHANEDFYGVYEQEPMIDEEKIKSLDPERAEKIREHVKRSTFRIEITPSLFRYSTLATPFGEATSIPYQIQGDFLLAEDEGIYWVIYLKEPSRIYSSWLTFNRVLEPAADVSAE
jgi:hypothetical protein